MTTELPRDVRLARQLHADMSVASVTRVIDTLDPIGEDSTSYPFLALARRIGAAYGDVLWYVSAVDWWRASTGLYRLADAIELGDRRMREAATRLSAAQKQEIEARYHELQRAER